MIRKDKRSGFGGKLGDELNEIWAALAANQIIPTGDLEVKESSSGVTLSPKTDTALTAEAGGKVIETKLQGHHINFATNQYEENWATDDDARVIALPPVPQQAWRDSCHLHGQRFGCSFAKIGMNLIHTVGGHAQMGGIGGKHYYYPMLDRLTSRGTQGYPFTSYGTGWQFYNSYYGLANRITTHILSLNDPIMMKINDPSDPRSMASSSYFTARHGGNIVQSYGEWYIKCDYLDLNTNELAWEYYLKHKTWMDTVEFHLNP